MIEISRFRLVDGTSEEAFLAAAEEVQRGFLALQPGFRGRELLRSDDGEWMDIVRFDSADAAQDAWEKFPHQPSAAAFERAIDASGASMARWSRLRAW